ncbi:hypothetical protein AB1M95_10585 [Sulfitobacter sp. LCG007]
MDSSAPSPIFDMLLWGGAAVSLFGLAGIIWCIFRVSRAKRLGLDDAQMKELIRSVLPVNLGALFLSVIGLMMVILGISLG